jgi:predicted MFS family arabinose efflux permease
MGLKQSGVQAAVFVCGLGLPPIAEAAGWRVAALAVVPFALVGLIVAATSIPRDEDARVVPSARPVTSQVPTGMVWMLSAYAVVLGAGYAGIAAFLPLYGTEEVGLSSAAAGATSAVMGIAAVVTRIVLGKRTEHVRSFFTPLAWLASLAGCAALLLWAASRLHGLVWIGAVLAGASAGSWMLVTMLAIVVRVPASHSGRMTARLFAAFMTGYAIGPPVVGGSVDATGNWGVGWTIILALCVGSLLLALASSDTGPADGVDR